MVCVEMDVSCDKDGSCAPTSEMGARKQRAAVVRRLSGRMVYAIVRPMDSNSLRRDPSVDLCAHATM